MKSAEIREKYLKFFESKGHTILPSSPLVPQNDPTLLFTNAGMVQFKDIFTGQTPRQVPRATTAQRCLRAGGKHNDLENVGYTARHHTFFEMMGNFSFGDYFKHNAIQYAWELLTEVYKLPKEKLWVTVYHEDDEAYNIWAKEVGVPTERIVRIGDNKGARYASDNFWQMADTGPCGPCTEIFYDHGPDIWGGPPGSPEEDGDRYIEIWNIVFMQFNRDAQGVMHPLPKPCVDTGMGLERIAAVLQHVHSNYEIDLFQHLIAAAARETGCTDLGNNSLKVIADHIRACTFLVVDGVIPSNEGRGYVLRRIIRRALRHGHKLGQGKPFFHRLVADLVKEMGQAYPELVQHQAKVEQVLKQEEERFQETLEKGMKILNAEIAQIPSQGVLPGHTAFTLYDTFGFPYDLTADICREHALSVDEAGFEECMAEQRAKARASSQFKQGHQINYQGQSTQFEGYEVHETAAKVLALYVEGTSVDQVLEGQDAVVVLDHTPFYAESGGQVGDCGVLQTGSAQFLVNDTQKIQAQVFGHYGQLRVGTLSVGDKVQALIDVDERHATMRNHSVTHIMHKALREVLGSHVQQKGSLVDPEKTRFDFAHDSALTPEQIAQVEQIVNAEVLENTLVGVRHMAYEDALEAGAVALFGEKYTAEVRVLNIGTSCELCGGTHVARTGDIGLFKIVSESGIAAGVRRIEAVTGMNAVRFVAGLQKTIASASQLIKCPPAELIEKLRLQTESAKVAEKEVQRLKAKLVEGARDQLLSQIQTLGNTQVLVARVEDMDAKQLRQLSTDLKADRDPFIAVLFLEDGGKVNVACGVSESSCQQLKAGEIIAHVCGLLGGKGGGRPDQAMGAGTLVDKVPEVMAALPAWLAERLG